MMRSPSLRVLLALGLGLALGMSFATIESFAAPVAVADTIGTLWTNAIRMTVIPLVAALTIASVAGAGATADLRRAMTRAVLVFVVLLVIATALNSEEVVAAMSLLLQALILGLLVALSTSQLAVA